MPYYAKPAKEKSQKQYDLEGNPIEWKPVGFAFNDFFINKMLREQMGFKGYINSDSGIMQMMAWGVEELESVREQLWPLMPVWILSAVLMTWKMPKRLTEDGKKATIPYRDIKFRKAIRQNRLPSPRKRLQGQ